LSNWPIPIKCERIFGEYSRHFGTDSAYSHIDAKKCCPWQPVENSLGLRVDFSAMSIRRPDCIIVGGGLAGLTCGVALAREGLRPLIIESDSILGGRARSWQDEHTGDPIHIGPHIFLSIYHNMLKLLDILGTRDKVVWQRGRFLTMVRGRREIPIRSAPLPPPMHFVPSVIADPTSSARDKASSVRVSAYVMQMSEQELLALDRQSAEEFLQRSGVSQNYIDTFWSFTCNSILNLPLNECSATSLIRWYRVLIGQKGYRFGFPDGGLGDVFAPAARSYIEDRHGEILLDTQVRQLLGTENEVSGVQLSTGEVISAPAVVSTLPPQHLDEILPAQWRSRHEVFGGLHLFEPCPYISPYLWFDRKVTNRQFWARTRGAGDLNTDFYDYANIISDWGDRGSFICSNIIYCTQFGELSDQEVVDRTLLELYEYLPAARRAKLTHSVVNRIPMAIHCPRPGTESLRPQQQTPIDGFYLGGDWTCTGLPSMMEGATRSGWLVAEHILKKRGRPAELAVDPWTVDLFPSQAARVLNSLLNRLPGARPSG